MFNEKKEKLFYSEKKTFYEPRAGRERERGKDDEQGINMRGVKNAL